MCLRITFLLIVFCTPRTNGFTAELLESMAEQHLRFVSGWCTFHFTSSHNPGELQVVVKTDRPTLDLYSKDYLSLGRIFSGMSYKIVNLEPVRRGKRIVKFTIAYYGTQYFSPKAWCEKITQHKQEPVTTPAPDILSPSPIRPELS